MANITTYSRTPIRAGSFSALKTYEECPYRLKLAKVDKIGEPDRPAPPKGGEHANDRGSRIHTAAEHFIQGVNDEIIEELNGFEEELIRIHEMFNKGKVESENLWCFDLAWNTVADDDWDNIWLRVIIDVFAHMPHNQALVADWKTGKRFRNEFKHDEQCRLYAVAAFARYPELEKVTTELWYVDLPPKERLLRQTFTRKQSQRFFRNFNERLLELTSCTNFEPKPNSSNCMFCPYGPQEYSNKWVNKSGHCEYGVA